MKKNILKVTLVVAIAIVCGTSFLNSQKSETLSDIALANVEALADYAYTSLHKCGESGLYCSLHLNGNLVYESHSQHFIFTDN